LQQNYTKSPDETDRARNRSLLQMTDSKSDSDSSPLYRRTTMLTVLAFSAVEGFMHSNYSAHDWFT